MTSLFNASYLESPEKNEPWIRIAPICRHTMKTRGVYCMQIRNWRRLKWSDARQPWESDNLSFFETELMSWSEEIFGDGSEDIKSDFSDAFDYRCLNVSVDFSRKPRRLISWGSVMSNEFNDNARTFSSTNALHNSFRQRLELMRLENWRQKSD